MVAADWRRQRFRGRADVEDVVQDILLTLHAIRHTYDPSRPFKPWLVAVARRRIVDRLRVEYPAPHAGDIFAAGT